MADQANVLLRSIARAFYPPEQVVILDAVLLHSALRDDDLALLMGQQTKHLRKMCSKLCEDGLLTVHSRAEQRPGAARAFNRDYYYVNTHRAIDVVKYRVKKIQKMVEKKYGQTVEEKKEFACPRCKSAYTLLEVIDDHRPTGFICKKCDADLAPIEDDGTKGAAGHEVQSRLNQQMAAFEKMLADIDDSDVPEQDFDMAIAKALPVKRDENINPGAKSEPVLATGAGAPVTVRGQKVEDEKVEVSLLDDDERRAEAEEEAKRKARFAEQNALPSWHTTSTVGAGSHGTNGASTPSANTAATPATNGVKPEGEDEKKPDLATADEDKDKDNKAALASIFASLNQDSEDDSDDSDDEDEDEDEDAEEEDNPSPAKKVRISEPAGLSGSGTPRTDEESGDSP